VTASGVLGLFAKWPAPGAVKTRLGGSPEWGAAVARAFLLDTLSRLSGIASAPLLAYTPPRASGAFLALIGDSGWGAITQGEGDLGARLKRFFHDWIGIGTERVVVVGTDSPTLPIAHVQDAFALLDHADVVLGPATDGGYYLVGCSRRVPPIFDGIDWSSDRVLSQTVARLSDPTWRLALLPPWYDVDTPEGWEMLRGHVAAMIRAGQAPGIPHTEALLTPSAEPEIPS
jgi:rSAM/selenodomain-associated transferase 1